MECYNCGQDGHLARQCRMPLEAPGRADSRDEHLARIDAHVERWTEGHMSTEQKRRAISDENRLWYGDECPRRLVYP